MSKLAQAYLGTRTIFGRLLRAVTWAPPTTTPVRFGDGFRNAIPWACLILIGIGVACRLRLLLACQSYWYDEAYLLQNIQLKGFADLLGPLINRQAAPPFFLWSLAALHAIFGIGEWAMRLPAALGGMLAVVIAFPLASRVVGQPGNLWAVAFAALSFQAITLGNDVKPYALDVLVTEVVLLAWAGYLGAEPGGRWRSLVLLLGLAAFAPWLSYPAAFTLGGVGVAWIVRARNSGSRLGLALFATVGVVSCALLWYAAARHQQTAELTRYWREGFIDRSSPWAALTSTVKIVRKMGDFATTGLGIPMLVLVPIGWVVIARRWPAVAGAMAASLLLALTASAAGAYPLDDRVTLFAAPLFWLPTAAALGAVVPYLKGIRGAVVVAALLFPAATDVVRIANVVATGNYGTEFREAYQYVHATGRPDDLIWQPYPEVYEVYHGTREGFGPLVAPDRVVSESAGHRLWLVAPPDGAVAGQAPLANLETRLVSAGRTKIAERPFRGVVARLYER